MKFIAQVILILLLAWLLELFFPWWSIGIAAFVGGFLLNTRSNFLAGFIAIAILWFFKCLLINNGAATELSRQVAELLFVRDEILLMLVTSAIGGLVGGFAAMSGSLLKTRKRRYRY